MTPAKTQGTDAAVTTAPDIEATLLAEEQQVQRDAEDLVKALEEANRKREVLAKKRWDAQVAREKHEAEQREADAKVRGKLLANAAVAEVRRRFVHQADKVRLAAEKLQAEWDTLWSPRRVRMKLGVSFSLFLLFFFFFFVILLSCRADPMMDITYMGCERMQGVNTIMWPSYTSHLAPFLSTHPER